MRDSTERYRSISRRDMLRALGGSSVVALAGCSNDGASAEGSGGDQGEASNGHSGGTESSDTSTLVDDIRDDSFEGELFDTHAHWAGASDAGHDPLDPGTFATRMNENDVGACVLFTSSVDAAQDYGTVVEQLATAEADYYPFLQPQSNAHLTGGEVTDVYSAHTAAFSGIGEIVFYGGPMQGTSITAEPWPSLFQFSSDSGVPLMVHPTQEQGEGLRTMLSDYPDATIMAHGGEFNMAPGTLVSLLQDHENLYWTIDAGSMLNGLVLTASGASDFVSRYDQRKSEFEQLVRQILPPVVDAAPDRVMWGTDLATDWNTDPEVYSRIMEWTNTAIDSLPADQQDKYAYENATRLFGL